MGKTYRDGIHGGGHTRGRKHNNIGCDMYGSPDCADCENFHKCNLTRTNAGKKANTKLKRNMQKRKEPLYTDEL